MCFQSDPGKQRPRHIDRRETTRERGAAAGALPALRDTRLREVLLGVEYETKALAAQQVVGVLLRMSRRPLRAPPLQPPDQVAGSSRR
jgi:hypothetical protein